MDKAKLLLFFITTSHILLISADNLCDSPVSCSPTGPIIQSPFWLKNQNSTTCGSQRFALSCNNKNQTILQFPSYGDFEVKYIDYSSNSIFINDPDSCLPNRIQNLTIVSPSFGPIRPLSPRTSYKFVNCSSNVTEFTYSFVPRPVKLSCLSGTNHSVYAVSSLVTDQELPSTCVRIGSNGSNSTRWVDSLWWSFMNQRGDIRLGWVDTRCFSCAAQGLSCGITKNGNEIGCVSSSDKQGLPRSARYGIIVGAGIPALVFIIGLVCYACGWVRVHGFRRRRVVADFSTAISPQSFPNITSGLDGVVIESYPKIVLGESRRFLKPNESTCSICLCEYRPKEALRTLPNCNHYFHCDCIDEWLRLNGSCPLCRNSPESRPMTPRPSVSSSITTPPS